MHVAHATTFVESQRTYSRNAISNNSVNSWTRELNSSWKLYLRKHWQQRKFWKRVHILTRKFDRTVWASGIRKPLGESVQSEPQIWQKANELLRKFWERIKWRYTRPVRNFRDSKCDLLELRVTLHATYQNIKRHHMPHAKTWTDATCDLLEHPVILNATC